MNANVPTLYAALVHHPVRDRQNETVTTAITNLDVHDLARTCRTYGLGAFYVVTPIEVQREIVQAILRHWAKGGAGQKRIPERGEALALTEPVFSVEEACDRIAAREGAPPRLWATAARSDHRGEASPLDYPTARAELATPGAPVLLLFGTGHGLAESLLGRADALLAPVVGAGDYNHLSVRAAAAIIVDRLCGGAP